MYFYILNIYKRFTVTGHVIQAENKKAALEIAEKYNISYPKRGKVVRRRIWKATDDQVSRRKKYIGGKIWYEENGELKYKAIEL